MGINIKRINSHKMYNFVASSKQSPMTTNPNHPIWNYHVDDINESDYHQVQPLVDTIRAFSYVSHQTMYVVDLFKQNLLFVSEKPSLHRGIPLEKARHSFSHDTQPENLRLLAEIYRVGLSAIDEVDVEDKKHCKLSYDFHLSTGGSEALINHKIIPVALSPSGKLWLLLCVATFSVRKDSGFIVFTNYATHQFKEYSLREHTWIEHKSISLKPEEIDLLVLSAKGLTMKEIANMIHRSVDTVKLRRKQVFDKLGTTNITEAYATALNHGLV